MKKALQRYAWDYTFLFLIAGFILLMDQWTKWLVKNNLPNPGDFWSPWPWLAPYVRIVHWTNTGAAFGMLQNFGDVFMVLAIIVSIAILFYFPQVPRSEWPLRVAMCLQLAGALGNLIDRLAQGHVIDFISVMNFAVFNIADASISVGVAVLVIGVWFRERAEKRALAKMNQAGVNSPAAQADPAASPHLEEPQLNDGKSE